MITAMLCAVTAGAQDINEVLKIVEEHNPTLKALREQAEADKLGNRKGISLPDPEIEGGRLWGRPAEIGNRVDFSISQGIDLATLSGARLRAAKRRNELVELGFLTQRTAILLQAKQLYIERTYGGKLFRQQANRCEESRELLKIYERKLQAGEVSQMEVNRIALACSTDEVQMSQVAQLDMVAHLDLSAMFGQMHDRVIWIHDSSPYPADSLPNDAPDIFEPWLESAVERTPAMIQARREAEVGAKEVGLARAEGLPQLKVGYMQERTPGQRYGGVTAGLSIPLWSNRNNVRAARAAASAAATRQVDAQLQIREQLRKMHYQASMREFALDNAQQALKNADNTALMRRALDAGEISLTDYLLDRQQYYDLQDKALEAERDYHLAMAELTAFEL